MTRADFAGQYFCHMYAVLISVDFLVTLILSVFYSTVMTATNFCPEAHSEGFLLTLHSFVTIIVILSLGMNGLRKRRKNMILVQSLFSSLMLVQHILLFYMDTGSMGHQIHHSLLICLRKKDLSHIEVRFNCCGVNSYKDYLTGTQGGIPSSCCGNLISNCDVANSQAILGCEVALADWIKNLDVWGHVLAFLLLATNCLEATGGFILFTMWFLLEKEQSRMGMA